MRKVPRSRVARLHFALRPGHLGRVVAVLALVSTIAALAAPGPRAQALLARSHVSTIAPSQQLAALLRDHEAMSSPFAPSKPLAILTDKRPLTGEQTVLPVFGHEVVNGIPWIEVLLPGRPNSRLGWIAQSGTSLSSTGWHLLVVTSLRRVVVYDHGQVVKTFSAIVGKASTPTPLGQFFVEESIQLAPSDVGAPYALALSARSNVLQEFEGGPGQIAMHGLENVGGVLGTAVSHGCIRLDSATMTWLVDHIAPGVPVTIVSS